MTHPIPQIPHMEESGLAYFKTALTNSNCYLEYGSGGSTIYAAVTQQVPVIISVESDKKWAHTIRQSLLSCSKSLVYIQDCDIGKVAPWGVPKNNAKINDYWRYMCLPWTTASTHHHVPDLILIDGRFRVASFLFSLISAVPGTPILFDDYLDRPEYFIVETFCPLKESKGRMGIFHVTKDFSLPEICQTIAQYAIVVD